MSNEGGPSSPSFPAAEMIKIVKFSLGRGNKTDSKLIVVHKDQLKDGPIVPDSAAERGGPIRVADKRKMPEFINTVLLHDDFLGPKPPKVLISVTGAATAYQMDAKLAQVFCKGLVNAAKSTTAWIVSGGTDVGVMHYVGEANRISVADVPTIGFATYNMINNKELLKTTEELMEYDATAPFAEGKNVNLNANHSHFVLVESNVDNWGEEIEARSDFEEYISSVHGLPLCLIVVNGGPGTLKTVAQGASREFPVVIFEGTGRAADAIAREVRRKRGMEFEHLQPMNLNPEQLGHLNLILEKEDCVTLYNTDQGPFDLGILKAILSYQHGSFLKKMELAVQWNRPDLAEHVLEAANDNKDNPITPEDLNNVLSKALELALDLEKPLLFRLLSSKGARKTDIDLNVLYSAEVDGKAILDPAIARFAAYIRVAAAREGYSRMNGGPNIQISGQPESPLLDRNPRVYSDGAHLTLTDQSFVKGIFQSIHPIFSFYAHTLDAKFSNVKRRHHLDKRQSNVSIHAGIGGASRSRANSRAPNSQETDDGLPANVNEKVKFTDAMLWAILMGKLELAKVIWEKTSLPVHTALVASGLCKGVANWLLNEAQGFIEAAAWFEQVAVKLLEKMSYENAKMLLTYNWGEFEHDAIQLAAKTECKDFIATGHAQRYLDELLYSNEKGGIPPGTNFLKVIACIIFPFMLIPWKIYSNKEKEKKVGSVVQKEKVGYWYHFYGLPYTKFWTSTFCYIGYLMLLAVVLVQYQGTSSISTAEIVLFVWMLAYAIEEISQLRTVGWGYFKFASNQMDVFIIALQICYFSCSLAADAKSDDYENDRDNNILKASTYLLIVTTIISYVRFMDVFSISKHLGPLYFVLQKIIGDVFKWIFVFVLFAIGFQISFMAVTEQKGGDKWNPVIKGGTFMGAVYIILGDDTTTSELASSVFGSILVVLYAIIAQIMLVNLLIAMMGDTFNSVKENSDKDWKYYRYDMIIEYTSTSFHPPPFNIIAIPLKKIVKFLRQKSRPAGYEPPSATSLANAFNTPKQKEKFKNLMNDIKDDYIGEQEEEETKTIGAVAELARENFKILIDEADVKYKSIDKQLQDIDDKIANIAPNNAPEETATNTELKMELNFVNESLAHLVKDEVAKLQETLLQVIKNEKPVDSIIFHMQARDVTVTWAESVQKDLVHKILTEFKPFVEWVASMNKPHNSANTQVQTIHIQAVDMFGPRIGFVKFHAKVVNETGEPVPGIVFMRGAAVAILVVLKLVDEGSPEHGKEFTILTIQPRVAAGESRFAEIPAGMLDGGNFVGMAAKELKEETGIEIKEDSLLDLTSLTYAGAHNGMYPSAGGCDEYLRLYLHRSTVSRAELDTFRDKCTGAVEEGEKISLKVIPLDDLWTTAPDAKALSALLLYAKLMEKGVISPDF